MTKTPSHRRSAVAADVLLLHWGRWCAPPPGVRVKTDSLDRARMDVASAMPSRSIASARAGPLAI
jgi:hypothetical protein